MANTAWNPVDKAAINLTNANLTATGAISGSGNLGGVRSVGLQTIGKFYWEYTPTVLAQASTFFAIANASATLPITGSMVNACGVPFGGLISLNGSSTGVTLGSLSTGGSGRSCFALDMANKLLWIRGSAAGSWNASSGSTNNPATGVGGINIAAITGAGIYAAFFSSSTDACTANFGDTAFSGAVPAGFTSGFPAGGGAAATQALAMVLA